MSNIKKTDQLSTRHRTEIHLQPAINADASGFPYEEPAGADSVESASIETPRAPLPLIKVASAVVPPKSVTN